jgi:hypothetical protein
VPDQDTLEAMARRVRAETWADPDAQARYLRALENAERSLYCVLAGTPSDRRQCAAEWAELLGVPQQ